jgi:heme exporter protein A
VGVVRGPAATRLRALSTPRLIAEDLACVRVGRIVFRGLSFALHPGDALLVRGPNGSGKSSLLRLLAGFLLPAAGRLAWAGQPVADNLPAYRASLHYVGHANGTKGVLSVRENLAFATRIRGQAACPIEAALETFGLAGLAAGPARHLSAGQQRRLALARLLAAPCELWLLDEPAVGLDGANRARLEQAVASHRADGGMTVIATHGDVTVNRPLILELPG